MILRTICTKCFQGYELFAAADNVEILKELIDENGAVRCPRQCGGAVPMSVSEDVQALMDARADKSFINLTAVQLYQAVNGLALPDEIPRSLEVVDALLKANRTQSVDLELAQDGRVYLHEIRLDNGVVLHLAAGGRGAHVFKITRPK